MLIINVESVTLLILLEAWRLSSAQSKMLYSVVPFMRVEPEEVSIRGNFVLRKTCLSSRRLLDNLLYYFKLVQILSNLLVQEVAFEFKNIRNPPDFTALD